MNIEIYNLDNKIIAKRGILSWPIWSCDISEFDWEYENKESCYILEGKVEVFSTSENVSFGVGDFVIFPMGLKCRWRVLEPVKKHYKFG